MFRVPDNPGPQSEVPAQPMEGAGEGLEFSRFLGAKSQVLRWGLFSGKRRRLLSFPR